MVERNWSGIAAYYESEEKISSGFVEGVTTKTPGYPTEGIRSPGRRILRMKVLTCMLPEI